MKGRKGEEEREKERRLGGNVWIGELNRTEKNRTELIRSEQSRAEQNKVEKKRM